jgi:hypothetical protein
VPAVIVGGWAGYQLILGWTGPVFTGPAYVIDAILDRLVHNAYRLELDGPSPRKTTGLDAVSNLDEQVRG